MATAILTTIDGRAMLAPLDQYMPYDSHDGCKLCDKHISAPHAIGCIHGDGFDDVNVIEARAIAAVVIENNGGWIASDFLNEFHLGRTHRDIVVDGVLHAFEGQRVLVRAINQPGAVSVFLISMATGDVIRLPRRQFNAVTTDADGRLIEAGVMVRDLRTGWTGTVTAVDFGTKVVMFKGKHQFGQRGDYLRILDQITIRWDVTVFESHHEDLLLADVAEALGIDTDGLTPDEIRQKVQAVLDEHTDTGTGSRRLRKLDALLCETEIDPAHAEHCHPSTENRTLRGHGEG